MLVYLYKGHRISRDDPEPESLHIHAQTEIPECRVPAGKNIEDHLKESRSILERDAQELLTALTSCLPGGTVSCLHALLTKHYANQLIIAWPELLKSSPESEVSRLRWQVDELSAEIRSHNERARFAKLQTIFGFVVLLLLGITCSAFVTVAIMRRVKGY